MPGLKEADISGNAKFKGGLRAERIRLGGSVKVEGDMEADEIEISGTGTVDGDVVARRLTISGRLEVGGSVRTEELQVSGVLRGGVVEAGEAEISGNAKFTELTAQRVRLRHSTKVKGRVIARVIETEKRVQADELYGDLVKVGKESKVKVVEGREVIVQKGADVKEVRYTEEAEIDPGASVGRAVRVAKLTREPG